MPPRLHQVAADRGLAELLAGFEAMQPLDQDEALAVRPHQDRGLLAGFEHALGDLAHAFRIERGAALHRHVDVRDRKNLGLQHVRSTLLKINITQAAGSPLRWVKGLRPGALRCSLMCARHATILPELRPVAVTRSADSSLTRKSVPPARPRRRTMPRLELALAFCRKRFPASPTACRP